MPSSVITQNNQEERQILQLLVGKELLTQDQLEEITAQAGERHESFLQYVISKRLVSEENIVKIKAELYEVSYIDLFGKQVPSEGLNLISEVVARTYQMVPFAVDEGELRVAIVNPQDFKALEAIAFLARKDNLKVRYYIVSPAGFRHLVEQYASLKEEVAKAIKQTSESDETLRKNVDGLTENEDVTRTLKSAPVIKMVSVILRHAVEGSASDVHIEPFEDGTRVRYRVDGVLHTSLILPKDLHSAIVARIKVMANLKIDQTRLPQDGRFRITVLNRNIDCRVSTLPLMGVEKVVMRILDTSRNILALEDLGFEGRNMQLMKESISQPHGMTLVTGPTGSGKSTTLYAMLTILNQEAVNIITLEDPIEYYIKGVNQSQINPEIGLTFAKGLRSILRQDPDVIMVGEIRDNETAELATHASLTGHRVLSTLHTNDAFGALPRLVDMKIEPFLIASSLNVVIAQRLVRKICEACVEEITLPKDMENEIWQELSTVAGPSMPKGIHLSKPMKFFRGKGCQQCQSSGYTGRIAISEVVAIDQVMKDFILNQVNSDQMKKEFLKKGNITMRQDGIFKALRGRTTIEEIMNVTKD